MGLSATEITNSTAGQYDVELRFYGGLTYSALTLSSYVAGAIDPSTSGWTNITARVNDAGSMTYERAGNSMRWSANIAGTQYASTYFGPGQAILCLRRILVAGVQTVPASGTWELWWLGQVTSGGMNDDYKHGGAWTRTIGGLDTMLQASTAPRLTAGRINLMTDASVTASSTLINAALEAGSGEFPGTLVSVAASNTIDGNINTLWISDGVPSISTIAGGTAMIQKVFSKPLTGYNQAKLWWIELQGDFAGGAWYLLSSAGLYLYFSVGEQGEPVRAAHEAGKNVIIAASASDFQAYTGGAQDGAVVFDAKICAAQGTTFQCLYSGRNGTFTLNPTADWICIFKRESDVEPGGTMQACIVWNQNGAAVSIPYTEPWTGGAIDVSDDLCPPGSGIRIRTAQDGGAAADYEITDLMFPGVDHTGVAEEWLLYTLGAQTAVLDGAVSAGAATITLSSTKGFLDNGIGICATDTFTYAGRTPTTLTGVSGISNHASGTAVHQVIDGVTQFGWPCNKLEILRPANAALPGITAGRVYLLTSNATPPKTPGTDDWELDYDGSMIDLYAPNVLDEVYDYGRALTGPDGGPRWTQYVLIVYDEMDGERARTNETCLYLAQTQINSSAEGDIGSTTACGLAQYIFNLAGVTTALSRGTSLDFGPWIGEHATAVAPYPQVLDDLGRITGCVMDWGLAGVPTWWADMWWPLTMGDTQYEARALLDATYLRGQAQYSGRKPNEVGVKIHARTPDGLHEYTAQFPPTMTAAMQRIELDDLVATGPDTVTALAQTMYYKAGLHYTVGPQELTFTLKGPGEWLRPEQWLKLASLNSTGETITNAALASHFDNVSWLTESITWEWGRNDAFRTWKATAKCRRYWR